MLSRKKEKEKNSTFKQSQSQRNQTGNWPLNLIKESGKGGKIR